MFGDIFERIYFFHCFIDDSVEFSHLVLDVLDFGMSYFDLLFCVELK